jgi:hypothetical protein
LDYSERKILKKSFADAVRIPSVQESIERLKKTLSSNYPLRDIGTNSKSGILTLSEEERHNHIHVLGTTREGKSKLLEQLLRQDIDRGFGATLLDPSDNGQTCYDVLKYCMKIGYDKVCFIDPHDSNHCIPTINPLRWKSKAATNWVVENVMDSMRLLWGQTDFANTPRIEDYLSAVLTCLYNTGNPDLGKDRLACTIPDSIYFSVKENRLLQYARMKILDCSHPSDEARLTLEEIFNTSSKQQYVTEFKSTIRRLKPFFKYLPRLIYGSNETHIDFNTLVAKGWVILVNLDRTRLWGQSQQRLLGTLIVNEIVNAVFDLKAQEKPWKGTHYLYIDEAGDFTTRALSDVMAKHGKSGLWATLAHQFYGQFEDKYVLDGVENNCKIKVMFNVPKSADRSRMIKDLYFGALEDEAADAHMSIASQNCVIKVNKNLPVKTRIADVETPEYTGEEIGQFKESVIYTNSWYRTTASVQAEVLQRFAHSRPPRGGGIVKPAEDNPGSDSGKQGHDEAPASKAPTEEPTGPTTASYFAQRKTK